MQFQTEVGRGPRSPAFDVEWSVSLDAWTLLGGRPSLCTHLISALPIVEQVEPHQNISCTMGQTRRP